MENAMAGMHSLHKESSALGIMFDAGDVFTGRRDIILVYVELRVVASIANQIAMINLSLQTVLRATKEKWGVRGSYRGDNTVRVRESLAEMMGTEI